MRKFVCAFALAALTLAGTRGASRAVSQSAVQVLFIGDRECGDDATTCVLRSVIPEHRYLHVILHDDPGNVFWRVQAAPACSEAMPDVTGGASVGSDGFLERVIDLNAVGAPASSGPLCLVFRGRSHFWATYYAAYVDDMGEPDASVIYPRYQYMGGRPDLPDLDVQFVHRSPTYPYDATKNVPAPGDAVSFTAQVANVGGEPAPGFTYQWLLDGNIIASGSHTEALAVGEKTTFSLTWAWESRGRDLRFEVVPTGDEISTNNDGLTIRTSAITLGFWIEQSAFEYFQDHQWLFCSALPCSGSDSFADWLQRQVSTWNHLFATAAYPGLAPAGIADRVRVDEITVVPDGTLPIHGGIASNSPDRYDHSVDLQWGIPSRVVKGTYHLHWENPFDVDWGMLHELGHARYLADLYRYDIPLSGSYSVNIDPVNGRQVFDVARALDPSNPLPAFVSGEKQQFLYQNRGHDDLMTCVCMPMYSPYDAVVLNRIRGRRATCGNANPPCNLGDWFLEMPPLNRLRIVDREGTMIADGTAVKLYFDEGASYTAHAFDETHSQVVKVSHGTVTLPRDVIHAGGSTWSAGHNLLLLRIPSPSGETLCFVEPTVFNMAYWLGYRSPARPATYRIRLGTQTHNDCNLQLPPTLVNEPFATSPDASTVRSRTGASPRGKESQVVTVTLKDDAVPPNPMRNRQVRLSRVDGRPLGSATTAADGSVRFTVPQTLRHVVIVDVTDNNLRWNASLTRLGA